MTSPWQASQTARLRRGSQDDDRRNLTVRGRRCRDVIAQLRWRHRFRRVAVTTTTSPRRWRRSAVAARLIKSRVDWTGNGEALHLSCRRPSSRSRGGQARSSLILHNETTRPAGVPLAINYAPTRAPPSSRSPHHRQLRRCRTIRPKIIRFGSI